MPSLDTSQARSHLHVAAWNLNHRTGRKAIAPAVIHALGALDIDVLVLTEYVDGQHLNGFKASLKDIGFEHLAISVKAPHQNQVLLASRTPIADDGLLPVPGHTEAATTNWLHRRLPELKLEVVGFRAPMYLAADDRNNYWRQVESIACSASDRRIVFIGDFSLDPHTDTRPCAAIFPRLEQDGFQLARPRGDWSYHAGKDGRGGTRCDHAFASQAVKLAEARYLYKAGRHTLAGPGDDSNPLSDHAVLSIRLERPVRDVTLPRPINGAGPVQRRTNGSLGP